MIMISDVTLNNVTEQATPAWMSVDNFAALMTEEKGTSLRSRIASMFRR